MDLGVTYVLGFGITAGGMGKRSRRVCVDHLEASARTVSLKIKEDKSLTMILERMTKRTFRQRAKARTLTILIGQPS